MRGEITLTYDFDEYAEALVSYLRMRKRMGNRWFLFSAMLALLLAMFWLIGFVSTAVYTAKPWIAAFVSIGLAAYATWSPSFVIRPSARDIARKSYDELHNEGHSTTYRFDDDRIEIEDHARGGYADWEDVFGWSEDETFVLIHRTPQFFYYFPKAKVDSQSLEALKACLTAASVKKY